MDARLRCGPILLLPSSLTALGGYRDMVLIIYGVLLLAGAFGLAFAPPNSLMNWMVRLPSPAPRLTE